MYKEVELGRAFPNTLMTSGQMITRCLCRVSENDQVKGLQIIIYIESGCVQND